MNVLSGINILVIAVLKANVSYMVFYPPVVLGGMIQSYITL
jgi:hypothetical protein